MPGIQFTDTRLEGLKIVTAFYAEDPRGYFLKGFERQVFRENGADTDVSETFESFSKHGVLRGLHFQRGQLAQSKLVRCIAGEVFDVCCDVRPGSPTFGQWESLNLSGENRKAFYIPRGFAHGFLVLSDSALLTYTCSGAHAPGGEGGIAYDDPDLNIAWPIAPDMTLCLSDRDRALPTLQVYLADQR